MTKQVAPPKVTGGGGNTFENKVATFYVAKMIAGLPPFTPDDGLITRIDFQTRVDGWYLDDILLTLDSVGKTHRRSLSVKSDSQFTMKRAPPDFVSTCWEQFLHEGSSEFNSDVDMLGIVVAPLGQSVSQALGNLKSKACAQSPADMARRISESNYMSPVERDLFASFSCPPTLASRHGISSSDTGRILSRILVSEFDFERADSSRLREADQACRDSLADPSQSPTLWDALLALVADHRAAGGFLDRDKILGRLRTRLRFRLLPFHEPDWKRLATYTSDSISTIEDAIGGLIKLPQDEMQARVEASLSSAPVVCLLGSSGLGKTVLAKAILQRAAVVGPAIWIDAQKLETSDWATFEVKIRLDHPLGDLIAAAAGGIVVIDGIEKVYSVQGFKSVALLLKKLAPLWGSSGWKTLLTCQPEEWDRVQRELFRATADPREWVTPMLELPKIEELTPLWEAFPQLKPISLRRDLHPILFRPKVLDLLAKRIALGHVPDFKSWIGESDFIKWFWESEVKKGPDAVPRARFAQLLAERQAALVVHNVPIDAFSVDDFAPLRGLSEDRICFEREGRISFGHDLYGDWARQRILAASQPELPELASRALSPLWHKAIRLYGLHLLETPSMPPEWVKLIRQAPEHGSESQWILTQDLLLEAVIFAAEPLPALGAALPELLANGGALLKRLLDRFLHVSTFPNPRIVALARAEGIDEGESGAYYRLPFWPLWLPMLRFLTENSVATVDKAPWALAKICETWLRRGGPRWPLRNEVARMALQLAEKYGTNDDLRSSGLHGEAEEMMFKAALAGASDQPEAVTVLARRLCRREDATDDPPQRTGVRRRRVHSPFFGAHEEIIPPPWPDGPTDRVNSAFQRVCLDSDALLPLIETAPSIATEVVLALLIDAPEPSGRLDYRSGLHFDYGLNEPQGWFPPLFTRGPFLLLLQKHPSDGLDCILRLVNFAVDRWRERGDDEAPGIDVSLPSGPRHYFGNFQMFNWHIGEMGPRSVETALMALEKYLYDQSDAGTDVGPLIDTILEKSNSVAPLGVLVALGNKKPELYLGALKPFLAVAELHEWERARMVGGKDLWRISWGFRASFETKFAAEWHQLPHRKRSLHDVALHWFHHDEEIRRYLNAARIEWEKHAASFEEDGGDRLLNLAALFDPANWHPDNSDPQQPKLAFVRPKELQERNAPYLKAIAATQKLLLFPMECRRIVDGEVTLQPEDLEQFWQQLQEIHTMETSQDREAEQKENSICGGIAALVVRNREWLFADECRRRWCEDYVKRLIQAPPPPTPYDSPVSRADWHWDRFCAQVAPNFWAEDPSSLEWRRCIATIAVSHHFETVSFLFASCMAVREKLGAEFSALQHLLLRWAATQADWYEETNGQDLSDLVKRRQAELEAFTGGRIPNQIPKWRDIAASRRSRNESGRRNRRPHELPGFEIQTLQAALTIWPRLAEARDEAERAEWIGLWSNALTVILDMIGTGSEEVDGAPYEYDRMVLGRIAGLIPELRSTESPDRLWKPILDLGYGAHYWIDEFLYRWFEAGRLSTRLDSTFFTQWEAMIDYARRSPQWGGGPSDTVRHRQELWWQLLGLKLAAHSFWTAERRDMANALKGVLREWAEAHLHNGDAALIFAIFLRREAAADLIVEGISWIDTGLKAATQWYWEERDIASELASTLRHAWNEHRIQLRASPPAMQALNRILAALVSRNEPGALQLRDMIARSTSS